MMQAIELVGELWIFRPVFLDSGEPGFAQLLAALAELAPDAATVFTPLPDEPALLAAGILAVDSAELENRWRAAIAPTFERLRMPMPPFARDPLRGRLDHGEAFRWLWSEFTMVRRSDPGATW